MGGRKGGKQPKRADNRKTTPVLITTWPPLLAAAAAEVVEQQRAAAADGAGSERGDAAGTLSATGAGPSAADGLALLHGCSAASTWAAQATLLKRIPSALVPSLATGRYPRLGSALAAILADMVLSDTSCTSLRAAVKTAASALPTAVYVEWSAQMSAGLSAAFPLPKHASADSATTSTTTATTIAAGEPGAASNTAVVYGSPEVAARLAAVRSGLQIIAAAAKRPGKDGAAGDAVDTTSSIAAVAAAVTRGIETELDERVGSLLHSVGADNTKQSDLALRAALVECTELCSLVQLIGVHKMLGSSVDTSGICETLCKLLSAGLSSESTEAAASALTIITVHASTDGEQGGNATKAAPHLYFNAMLNSGGASDGGGMPVPCGVSLCWGLLTVSSAHAVLVQPLDPLRTGGGGSDSSTALPPPSCLLDTVLGILLEARRAAATATDRAAAIKAIVVWTTVACNNAGPSNSSYTLTMAVVDALVDWVWSWWDDAIDRIKHQVFRLFEGALAVHQCLTLQDADAAAAGGADGDALSVEERAREWRSAITAKLLASIKAGNRGAFGCCVILVERFGQQSLLDLAPALPNMLLEMFDYDQSTATATASVVDAMLKDAAATDAADAAADGEDREGPWRAVWLPLLATHLQSPSALHRKRLAQLVLPKLFDAVDTAPRELLSVQLSATTSATADSSTTAADISAATVLTFAPSSNSSSSSSSSGGTVMTSAQLAGLVTTLKVANAAKRPAPFNDAVPTAVLVSAVLHADDNLRLDTLTLLCAAKKATQPIPLETFDAIALGFAHNMVGQTAAFRNDLVEVARRLHTRLIASARHCYKEEQQRARKRERDSNAKSNVDGSSGGSGGGGAKMSSRKAKSEAMLSGINPAAYVRAVQGFLEWFRRHLFASLSLDLSQQRRLTALELLRVHAATYSTPAAVADAGLPAGLRLDAGTLSVYERSALIGTLSDSFEANRHVTLQLLEELGMDMVALNSPPSGVGTGTGSADIAAGKGSSSDSGKVAFYTQVMDQIAGVDVRASAHAALLLQAAVSSPNAGVSASDVCNQLVALLDRQMDVATKSLLAAANAGPMYTVLFALRLVITQVNLDGIANAGSVEEKQAWKITIVNLIERLKRVSSVVFDVVSNSSPEGYVPDDDGDGGDDDSAAAAAENDAAAGDLEGSGGGGEVDGQPVWVDADGPRGSPAQLILVCCWRSMKEMALVVDALFKTMPLPHANGGGGSSSASDHINLIDAATVMNLGSTMRQLATDARHRGAVENIAVGFSTIVNRLWRHGGDASLAKLPESWLAEIMDQIQSPAPLSITRRSAGFAQVVLVLLVGAPAASKSTPHPVVEATVTALVEVAKGASGDGTPGARAHGLNVLRVILRDASIGSSVLHHIAEIAELAIDGFEAEEFPIRNSSLMLFSAIVARLFGVKRVRDEHDVSNLLPTNTLFSRYPDLYSVFKRRLELGLAATVVVEGAPAASTTLALAPAVYPVLILLGRLTCSAMTGPISSVALEQLRSLVGAHAASPMLLIRRAAARAFAMLCPADKLLDEITASLTVWSGARRRVNTIHGHQIQTLELLRKAATCGNALSASIANSIANHLAGAAIALLLKSGGCPELVVAAGNVFAYVLSAAGPWAGPLLTHRPDVAQMLGNVAWANLQRQSPYQQQSGHPSPGLLSFSPGHPGAALCLRQSATVWAMLDLRPTDSSSSSGGGGSGGGSTGTTVEARASVDRWAALLVHWDSDARLGALTVLGDAAADGNAKAGQVLASVINRSVNVPYDPFPECAVAMARALRLWLVHEQLPWKEAAEDASAESDGGDIAVAAVMTYAAMPEAASAGGIGGEVTAAELIALRGAVIKASLSSTSASQARVNADDLSVLLQGCAVDSSAAERLASATALESIGVSVLLGDRVDRDSAWKVWRTLLPMMQDDDVAVQASAVRTICAAANAFAIKQQSKGDGSAGLGSASAGAGASVGAGVCSSRALKLGLATFYACWSEDPAVLGELLALAVPASNVAALVAGMHVDNGAGAAGGGSADADEAVYTRLFELDAATHSSFAEPDVSSSVAASILKGAVGGGGGGGGDASSTNTLLAAEWARLQRAELPAALERYTSAKRSLDAANASGLVAAASTSYAQAALARASQAVVLLATGWGGAAAAVVEGAAIVASALLDDANAVLAAASLLSPTLEEHQ